MFHITVHGLAVFTMFQHLPSMFIVVSFNIMINQFFFSCYCQDDEIQAAVDNRGCNDEEDDDSKLREMSLSGQVVREIACTENGVLCGAFPSEFGTFDRQYTG